jgi:DNA-directed RNA polymerase subunit F
MAQKILNTTPINTTELFAEMKRIKDRDKELGFRAQKTVDYLESLNIMDSKKGRELFDKLMKLEIPRLREMHFHKIIDLMPSNQKDVKTILQGYNVTVSAEACKKIADAVAEYV